MLAMADELEATERELKRITLYVLVCALYLFIWYALVA